MRRIKRRRGDKRNAQLVHIMRRASTRYGFEWTPRDLDKMIRVISKNSDPRYFTYARHIEQQSHRVSVWLINWEGVHIPVVYDKVRKSVVSALPPEYLTERGIPLRPTQ